jgi:hypothetical protein
MKIKIKGIGKITCYLKETTSNYINFRQSLLQSKETYQEEREALHNDKGEIKKT